jgi:hypothetical protein
MGMGKLLVQVPLGSNTAHFANSWVTWLPPLLREMDVFRGKITGECPIDAFIFHFFFEN